MAVYIIRTDHTENACERSPYREYGELVKKLQLPEHYDQTFSYSAAGDNAGFSEDQDYFTNPEMKFSFHRIDSGADEERILIRHTLRFEIDPQYQEDVLETMNRIKAKFQYLCIPDADEFSFSYEIGDDDVQMIMNAALKKENLYKTGIYMISLDIACMARGW